MDGSGTATMDAASTAPSALHPKHAAWIEARGISAELARKLGLATVQRDGRAWLAVPYVERGRTINHKYRLVSEKRHQMDEGSPLCLWNHDCLIEESDRPVVICEGEWDAMIALQLGWRAVSVPNGAPAQTTDDVANAKRYEYLWRSRDDLLRVKRFILATDGDGPGIALRHDLVALLGADRCSFVEYPSHEGEVLKDLNDVLLRHGAEEAARVLNAAKPVPVRGLFKVKDFPEPPPLNSIPIGVPGLSALINVVPGTLTVLTGWAGQGKTSLTMAIVAHLLRSSIGVALGTFETMPRPILERRLRAAIIRCQEYSIPVEDILAADKLIDAHLNVIAQMVGEEQEMTLEDVLELARVAVQRDGAKVLILDPWNEIEHKRRVDETETEYVGRALRALRRFAQQHQVAVWLVAHPTKPQHDGKAQVPGLYHISGSANWANKPDYGLVYTRPNKETNLAKVYVVKVKMGLPGKEGCAEIEYDFRSSSYREAPTQAAT